MVLLEQVLTALPSQERLDSILYGEPHEEFTGGKVDSVHEAPVIDVLDKWIGVS